MRKRKRKRERKRGETNQQKVFVHLLILVPLAFGLAAALVETHPARLVAVRLAAETLVVENLAALVQRLVAVSLVAPIHFARIHRLAALVASLVESPGLAAQSLVLDHFLPSFQNSPSFQSLAADPA